MFMKIRGRMFTKIHSEEYIFCRQEGYLTLRRYKRQSAAFTVQLIIFSARLGLMI